MVWKIVSKFQHSWMQVINSVSKLSQRNSHPHLEHMQAAKRILRYLRGTIEKSIVYRAGEKSMTGFVAAD